MTKDEERILVRIARLSELKYIAKERGEFTLYALIDMLLDAEVNS